MNGRMERCERTLLRVSELREEGKYDFALAKGIELSQLLNDLLQRRSITKRQQAKIRSLFDVLKPLLADLQEKLAINYQFKTPPSPDGSGAVTPVQVSQTPMESDSIYGGITFAPDVKPIKDGGNYIFVPCRYFSRPATAQLFAEDTDFEDIQELLASRLRRRHPCVVETFGLWRGEVIINQRKYFYGIIMGNVEMLLPQALRIISEAPEDKKAVIAVSIALGIAHVLAYIGYDDEDCPKLDISTLDIELSSTDTTCVRLFDEPGANLIDAKEIFAMLAEAAHFEPLKECGEYTTTMSPTDFLDQVSELYDIISSGSK